MNTNQSKVCTISRWTYWVSVCIRCCTYSILTFTYIQQTINTITDPFSVVSKQRTLLSLTLLHSHQNIAWFALLTPHTKCCTEYFVIIWSRVQISRCRCAVRCICIYKRAKRNRGRTNRETIKTRKKICTKITQMNLNGAYVFLPMS